MMRFSLGFSLWLFLLGLVNWSWAAPTNGSVTPHLLPRLVPQLGHSVQVRCVAMSPNNRLVATGGQDWIVKLWDVATGSELRSLSGLLNHVERVRFSRDGQQIFAVDTNGNRRVWTVATGQLFTGKLPPVAPLVSSGKVGVRIKEHQAELYEKDAGKTLLGLRGKCRRVVNLQPGPQGNLLQAFTFDPTYYTTGKKEAMIDSWGSSRRESRVSLPLGADNLRKSRFSPLGDVLAIYTTKGVQLFDTNNGVLRGKILDETPICIAFSQDGRQIAAATSQGISLWNTTSCQQIRTFSNLVTVSGADVQANFHLVGIMPPAEPNILSLAFSPDGSCVAGSFAVLNSRSKHKGIFIWDVATGKKMKEMSDVQDDSPPINAVNEPYSYARTYDELLHWSHDGRWLMVQSNNYHVQIWDVANAGLTRTFDTGKDVISRLVLAPDNRTLAIGTESGVRLCDIATGKTSPLLTAGENFVSGVVFSPDHQFLFSGSFDGTIHLWRLARDNPTSAHHLCTMMSFADGSWAVVDEQGRYDASNGGDVEGLHWVLGNEPIGLKQFQEAYYEPNLLAKMLGADKSPLRAVPSLTDIKLYPEIEVVPPAPGTNRLTIKLKNQGGGLGAVRVLVNGKQLEADARQSVPEFNTRGEQGTLSVNLSGAAIVPGKSNEIMVSAYNSSGTVESRAVRIAWKGAGKPAPTKHPQLYAIVAGIGTYADPQQIRTLTFAPKDARDIAHALLLAGRGPLFGPDNVHIHLLSSDTVTPPAPGLPPAIPATKANFRRVFDEVARQIRPEDVLVVYLSGHGLTLGQGASVYCYPTQEARTSELANSPFLQDWAITSEELTQWTDAKHMAAQKQVLILDTCAAGSAAEQLNQHKEISGDEVRALTRLNARSGFHVLMGSASDASSFEASRYGQGLLTYALLEGLRGPALRADAFVDVADWFRYAEKRVPELAQGVGGVQQPQIAAPRGSTFDVGELTPDERAQILLAGEHPLVLRPRLSDEGSIFNLDTLALEAALRASLRDATAATTSDPNPSVRKNGLIFVDATEMLGAITIGGRYKIEGEAVTVRLGLLQNGQQLGETLEVQGVKSDVPALAKSLVRAIQAQLNNLRQ